MAKVKGNIFMDRISGSIGDQMVLKRVRGGGTILCKKPTFREDREFSQAQLAQQQAFREATAYGKRMKHEPVYLSVAQGTTRTGFNVAVGDWRNPPQIPEIDLGGWHGAAQERIRMRMQDDVRVTQVEVQISDGAGTVLEAGPAAGRGGAVVGVSRPPAPVGGADRDRLRQRPAGARDAGERDEGG